MNGKQMGAGTAAHNVFIQLVGRNGHSGKVYLQSYLSLFTGGTFKRNELENLIIESSGDLGEIEVVILGIDDSLVHYSWYVNEIGIHNCTSKSTYAFPCYHWIGSGHSVSMIVQTGNDVYNIQCI